MALLQENKHSYLDVVGVVRNSCKANYDKNVAYYLLKKVANFLTINQNVFIVFVNHKSLQVFE